MIQLTRLNHIPLIVNSDLIEHIEVTPDTVITLSSGLKFMVLETAHEIVDRIVEFRRSISGCVPAACAARLEKGLRSQFLQDGPQSDG